MKIIQKLKKSVVANIAAASKSVKSTKNEVVKASKSAAKEMAKEVKQVGLSIMEAYSSTHCKQALKEGLDGAGAWLGSEINDKLMTSLLELRAEIKAARLAKTDRVLCISARQAFAWPLTGISGDTYGRTHDKHEVRGSLSALRKAYGPTNVKVVSRTEAVKFLKTLTPEKASAITFGLAKA